MTTPSKSMVRPDDGDVPSLIFTNAFAWLCYRRQHFPAQADIWEFRRAWPQQAAEIAAQYWRGKYTFGIQQHIVLA